MNAKTVKILRKVAPKLNLSYEEVYRAFNSLDSIQQIKFLKKAKERFAYYEKHNTDFTERSSAIE